MKKILIILTTLLCIAPLFGQEKITPIHQSGNNEFYFNIATAVLSGSAEISYERILTNNTSVGFSGIFLSDNNITEVDIRKMFNPYIRYYAGKRKATGFFIEGGAALLQLKGIYSDYSYWYDPQTGGYMDKKTPVNQIGFGFTIAGGLKILLREGYHIQAYLGVGRNYIKNDAGFTFFPRCGLSIGKRF